MSEYDLVVRAGTVVDGSGGDPFLADVAVIGGRIAEVGNVRGSGARDLGGGRSSRRRRSPGRRRARSGTQQQ